MVVVEESGGEGRGDNFIRIVGFLLGRMVEVDTKVTESEIKVIVGVEVGERKNMIFSERRLRRANCGGFEDVYFHIFRWTDGGGSDRKMVVIFGL